MLACVTIAHVDLGLCGERDFARRRRLSPYTFFYYAVGYFEQLNLNAEAQSVCTGLDSHVLLISA
jgi:hypothetical protein